MTQITQEGNRWIVIGAMTVVEVNALIAQSANLTNAKDTEIDLAGVTEVDTTAISLLFEWLRQSHSHKCKMTFNNLPPNLISLATLYGVLDLIPQHHH